MNAEDIETKSIADDLKLHYGSLISGADLSAGRNYRWRLWRIWDWKRRPLVYIMLNPSIADEWTDDPTIVRCVERARLAGHGGIEVVNLYAWRVTSPRGLRLPADPIGTENDAHIAAACRSGGRVVLAWGAHADARRASVVYEITRSICPDMTYIIGGRDGEKRLTKSGMPRHPLMLSYDDQFVLFDSPLEKVPWQ